MTVTRKTFLRLGAGGVAAAALPAVATVALPAVAPAAPPAPAPVGDDLGFLAFGVVGERTALTFYRRALAAPGLFTAAERRRLSHARRAKRAHVQRLNAALGADAVAADDYAVDFPKSAFATRARALDLGERLEELLVGVYLNGAGYAADAGTRLLVARLLAADAQLLAVVRMLAGKPVAAGLPMPLSTEAAGAVLDELITVTGQA